MGDALGDGSQRESLFILEKFSEISALLPAGSSLGIPAEFLLHFPDTHPSSLRVMSTRHGR